MHFDLLVIPFNLICNMAAFEKNLSFKLLGPSSDSGSCAI